MILFEIFIWDNFFPKPNICWIELLISLIVWIRYCMDTKESIIAKLFTVTR